VGGAVYFRTDNQVKQLLELQRTDQVRFAAEEGPRIHTVVKSFGQYRIGYAVAVIFALGFVFLTAEPLFQGLAVGLLILAALGFTIDFYAEERAVQYVHALESAGVLARQ